MSQSVVSVDGLTVQERKFVEAFAAGLNQTQAARAAGYKDPSGTGSSLLRRDEIRAAVMMERAKLEEAAQLTRKDVVAGFIDAVEMAKRMEDPLTMIAGYRELGKLLGYYEAQKTQLNINIDRHASMVELERLPDEKLLEILEAEVLEEKND
jgi:hypothetical protein